MSFSLRGRVGRARLRASRAMGWLAGVALATPVVLALIQILFHPWTREIWLPFWRTSLVGGVALSLLLALGGALTAAIKPASEGVLRVEAGDLLLETAAGVERVPLASLRSGVVVPRPGGARIELSLLSGDNLFADVASLAEGERTLRALGLDAAKRRCNIPLVPRASNVIRRVGWVIATIMTGFMVLGMVTKGQPATVPSILAWLGGTTLAVALATYLTRQREITIGADGVLLPKLLGSRFLRFDSIRSVKAVGRAVRFELVDAADVVVRVGRTASAETASAIALRVQEAIRARSESPEMGNALSLVARAGRTLAEWRHSMEGLVRRTQAYRGVALSSDDLAAILESPASSEEQRIGAALGLLSLGDEHKDRVRIAANACAREPMRVALDKLAEGEVDEAAVEEALASSESATKDDESYM